MYFVKAIFELIATDDKFGDLLDPKEDELIWAELVKHLGSAR